MAQIPILIRDTSDILGCGSKRKYPSDKKYSNNPQIKQAKCVSHCTVYGITTTHPLS